jgi:hypothetical protein
MSRTPWDPPLVAAHDPLADLVTGLVSAARSLRATLDAAAPPVTDAPSPDAPSPDTLALLGALSLCASIERTFGVLPASAPAPAPPAGPVSGGSLLR